MSYNHAKTIRILCPYYSFLNSHQAFAFRTDQGQKSQPTATHKLQPTYLSPSFCFNKSRRSAAFLVLFESYTQTKHFYFSQSLVTLGLVSYFVNLQILSPPQSTNLCPLNPLEKLRSLVTIQQKPGKTQEKLSAIFLQSSAVGPGFTGWGI